MTDLTPPDAEPKPKEPILMLCQLHGAVSGPVWLHVMWYPRCVLPADYEWAGEADEDENGDHFCPAGWYELSATSARDDIEAWTISGELLGWVPMPPIPEEYANA